MRRTMGLIEKTDEVECPFCGATADGSGTWFVCTETLESPAENEPQDVKIDCYGCGWNDESFVSRSLDLSGEFLVEVADGYASFLVKNGRSAEAARVIEHLKLPFSSYTKFYFGINLPRLCELSALEHVKLIAAIKGLTKHDADAVYPPPRDASEQVLLLSRCLTETKRALDAALKQKPGSETANQLAWRNRVDLLAQEQEQIERRIHQLNQGIARFKV
jgi:hypothetical protein